MHKAALSRILTAVVLAATAVFALILLSLTEPMAGKSPELILKNGKTGEIIKRISFGEDKQFSIRFLHSVNKTDVEEIYHIENGKIYLEGCIYYSFGAGVAEELPPEWKLTFGKNGEMILSEIHTEMQRLSYFIGTIYDHILKIDGREYSLTELCGKNTKVLFGLANIN
ncbi:MAG: DUF1850 domain-containing protein [Ruminococcaceae bacterium]|nr:DUF1850 domain-containing protein [Oscillospiraceae bacterium]